MPSRTPGGLIEATRRILFLALLPNPHRIKC